MNPKQENTEYSCCICKFTTTNSLTLDSHLKVHIHEESVYLCPHCEFTSNRPYLVVAHMKNHEPKNGINFLNDINSDKATVTAKTNSNTNSVDELDGNCAALELKQEIKTPMHLINSTGATDNLEVPQPVLKSVESKRIRNSGSLLCTVCEKNFRTKQTLRCHMKLHTVNKMKCTDCDFVCDKRKLMTLHKKIHYGKQYPCNHCPEIFPTCKSKNEHVKQNHADIVFPFVCKLCGYSCDNISSLKKHTEKSHVEKKKKLPILKALHSCPYCSYSTDYSTNYLQHVRTHTGERPYKCNECDYRAAQSSSLKMHMMRHFNKRPFKCLHCQASFRISGHLSKHLKIHEGKKEYQCDICRRYFTAKHNMERHRNQHDVDYRCTVCNKVFMYSKALKAHQKSHEKRKHTIKYSISPCVKTVELQSLAVSESAICKSKNIDDCSTSSGSGKGEKSAPHNSQISESVVSKENCRANIFESFSDIFENSKRPSENKCFEENSSSTNSSNRNLNSDQSHLQMELYNNITVMPEQQKYFKTEINKLNSKVSDNSELSSRHLPELLQKTLNQNIVSKLLTKFRVNNICKSKMKSGVLHDEMQNSEVGVSCPFCSINFTCRKQLKLHLQFHKELDSYTCTQCKEAFPFKATLKSHMKSQHLIFDLPLQRESTKRKVVSNHHLVKEKIDLIDQILCDFLEPLKKSFLSNKDAKDSDKNFNDQIIHG